ncbi:hypothetical protein GCM10025795_54410 [Verticiella sediminum]
MACALAMAAPAMAAQAQSWHEALVREIEEIDADSPGRLGVYVKRLSDGQEMRYAVEGPWYLASTVKVPIALAVLEAADDGDLGLEDTMTLEDTDRIDGAGDLVWQDTGSTYTVDELLEAMLMRSDNTAANLLIRKLGADQLNRRVAAYMGKSANVTLTDFSTIRRDIYGELHEDARNLPNEALVRIAGASIGPARVRAVRDALDVGEDALAVATMPEAYARYYATQRNMAPLDAYGAMLERLVAGDLLSDESRARLFAYMKLDEDGDYRLEGGLPQGIPFIHKTGTQFEQACHVGVAYPESGRKRAVVVAACASGLDEAKEAGAVLRRIGRAVADTVLREDDGG